MKEFKLKSESKEKLTRSKKSNNQKKDFICSPSVNDWWNDLSEKDKTAIIKGLNDMKNQHTLSHDLVKEKYGL
ncbi:MAG: hypothetical protein WC946_02700 [Bacteroidales bacterium]